VKRRSCEGRNKDQTRITPELVDKATADRLYARFTALGINVSVSAEIFVAYKDDDGTLPLQLVETQTTTLYTQGIRQPNPDVARDNLANVLTQFINEDHNTRGNSPIRIIIDPLVGGFSSVEELESSYDDEEIELSDGMAYESYFKYRVYRPIEG
jgi:antitoxin component of RelBE/YafQ-DinJ toxin-antitoxin module